MLSSGYSVVKSGFVPLTKRILRSTPERPSFWQLSSAAAFVLCRRLQGHSTSRCALWRERERERESEKWRVRTCDDRHTWPKNCRQSDCFDLQGLLSAELDLELFVHTQMYDQIETYSLVHWNWFSDVTDACNSGASSDVREPISLHQAVRPNAHSNEHTWRLTFPAMSCSQVMAVNNCTKKIVTHTDVFQHRDVL